MLKILRDPGLLPYSQLMAIYEQSNLETGSRIRPNGEENVRRFEGEQALYAFLQDFLRQGNILALWEQGGAPVAAVRAEPYSDGYLLTGLETQLDARNRGYGTTLLCELVKTLDGAVYSHIHKTNQASLAVHKKCGFQECAKQAVLLDGTVSSEYSTFCYKSGSEERNI